MMYQINLGSFPKLHNMPKNPTKGIKNKKDKGMFKCRPTTMEIEHIDENCVIYIYFHIFLQLIIKLTINLLQIYQ